MARHLNETFYGRLSLSPCRDPLSDPHRCTSLSPRGLAWWCRLAGPTADPVAYFRRASDGRPDRDPRPIRPGARRPGRAAVSRNDLRARVGEDEAVGQRIADALGEYAGTFSAVAEMTTTLCIRVLGAFAFHALTPGMISMAPDVADAVARTNAIATFPLGQTLGGMWHGVFAADASPWLVGATVAGLVVSAVRSSPPLRVLADPVQSRFGVHSGRLGPCSTRWRWGSPDAETALSLRAWLPDVKPYGPSTRIMAGTSGKRWRKCTSRLQSSFC